MQGEENLRQLPLRRSYRKGRQDIAGEFYVPCLKRAFRYDRAVGFFRSTIFTLAWPALRRFIQEGGKIRVVCSEALNRADLDALEEGYDARKHEVVGGKLKGEFERMLRDEELNRPARLLAALVAEGIIELSVAFVIGTREVLYRIFHDKVGIFRDHEGNRVAFKGSMNESWQGLSADGNIESVDVFVSWQGEREFLRVQDEVEFFQSLWQDEYPGVKVKEFPKVARDRLIEVGENEDLLDLVRELEERYREASLNGGRYTLGNLTAYEHQRSVLENWREADRRGLVAHATGAGKTFTALLAIREAFEIGDSPLVVVPTEILQRQWHREIRELFGTDVEILLAGGGNSKWKKAGILRSWSGPSEDWRITLATVDTASSDNFIARINDGEHLFLVADEVHTVGSPSRSRLLDLESGPRLGLSATPRRYNDREGTEKIFDYFGDILEPRFGLREAIEAGALTQYMYHPVTVELTGDELEEYKELSSAIAREMGRQGSDGDTGGPSGDRLERLLFSRASIVKGASQKANLAADLVSSRFEVGQQWFVYCDSRDQMNDVAEQLRDKDIRPLQYHYEMAGDREETLRHFEAEQGIMLAIKCLDEGVDIPSVTHALILASSKNPREFIQRRGRVLRRSRGKTIAHIFDAVVIPGHDYAGKTSSSILEAELSRAIRFGQDAVNPSAVAELRALAARYGIDVVEAAEEGFEDE